MFTFIITVTINHKYLYLFMHVSQWYTHLFVIFLCSGLQQDIHIKVCAILNDTTGTLMSCAWKNHNCKIGLIVGRFPHLHSMSLIRVQHYFILKSYKAAKSLHELLFYFPAYHTNILRLDSFLKENINISFSACVKS